MSVFDAARTSLSDAIRAIRRPEYTGDRRCGPCTILNSAIVAIAFTLLAPIWAPLALAVLFVGAIAIALRGYVVPYTPEFAPRLAERLPFGIGPQHAPESSDTLTDDDGGVDGERLLVELVEAGVLVEDETGVHPSESFYDDWEAEMAALRDLDPEALGDAVVDAIPADATYAAASNSVLVETEADSAWLSRPVAIVETAALRAMETYGVADEVRQQAVHPLRMFTAACPVCGGAVEETTYRGCCGGSRGVYRSPEQSVLACTECDALVYEFEEEVDEETDEGDGVTTD